jgi:hypothetical protein
MLFNKSCMFCRISYYRTYHGTTLLASVSDPTSQHGKCTVLLSDGTISAGSGRPLISGMSSLRTKRNLEFAENRTEDSIHTKRQSRVGCASASRSGDAGFYARPGDWICRIGIYTI